METVTINESQTGCWLSNARGHYLSRDIIDLATGFGFIIGPFEEYAVRMYDDANDDGDQTYPFESIIELADEATAWLNTGQGECDKCGGTGKVPMILPDNGGATSVICKACSGTGRGDRIDGQNFPPRIPEGYMWASEDGDFGLWQYDDEGNFVYSD